MKCRYCKQEIPKGNKFCPHCGKKIREQNSTAASFWLGWIFLLMASLTQVSICLFNLNIFQDIINTWDGSFIHLSLYFVIGFEGVILNILLLLVCKKNRRTILLLIAILLSALVMLLIVAIQLFLKNIYFNSSTLIILYGICVRMFSAVLPVLILDALAMGISVLFMILKK